MLNHLNRSALLSRCLASVSAKAPICAAFFCWIELFLYSIGYSFPYRDLPRASSADRFFDLRIWTFNGFGCDIPIQEIALKHHCAIDSYMFNYPTYPLWVLRFLRIGSLHHWLVGLSIGTVAITLFTYFAYNLRKSVKVNGSAYTLISASYCLCILSFPFRYALERGQIDVVVFSVLLIGILPRPSGGSNSRVSVFSLRLLLALIISTLVKAFTLPCLLLIWALSAAKIFLIRSQAKAKHKTNATSFLKMTVVITIIFFLILPQALVTNSVSFLSLGGHGFGLQKLIDAAYVNSAKTAISTKVAFLLAGFYLFSPFSSARLNSEDYRKHMFYRLNRLSISEVYILMIACFLPMLYLLTENINYKWIFIVPIPIACYALVENKRFTSCRKSLDYLSVIVLADLLLLALPYSPVSYVYAEWLAQFALHPLTMGGLLGAASSILFSSQKDISIG